MQSTPLLTLTGTASGAVTGGRAVGYNDAQATVAGQRCKGIARSSAASGANFPVDVKGTTEWETGASAIAVGDPLVSDSSGRCTPASNLAIASGATAVTSAAANGASALTGSIPPQHIIGYALKASSGAGNYIEVLLV